MHYTFHNGGTVSSFNPQKRAERSDTRTMLDVHLDMVAEAGRRDVYILDQKGREVACPALAQVA